MELDINNLVAKYNRPRKYDELLLSYLSDLHWSAADELKKIAIKNILHYKNLNISELIMPIHPDYWECASEVLLLFDEKKLRPYIYDLFWWIDDPHVQGAGNIRICLQKMPPSFLREAIEVFFKSYDWQFDLTMGECLFSVYLASGGKIEDFKHSNMLKIYKEVEKNIWEQGTWEFSHLLDMT